MLAEFGFIFLIFAFVLSVIHLIVSTKVCFINFSEISLGEPSSLLQGFFFSSIKHNDDLFIQTPCVSCKSGFVKSGSKHHMDIILKNEDEKILEWFENFAVNHNINCLY